MDFVARDIKALALTDHSHIGVWMPRALKRMDSGKIKVKSLEWGERLTLAGQVVYIDEDKWSIKMCSTW